MPVELARGQEWVQATDQTNEREQLRVDRNESQSDFRIRRVQQRSPVPTRYHKGVLFFAQSDAQNAVAQWARTYVTAVLYQTLGTLSPYQSRLSSRLLWYHTVLCDDHEFPSVLASAFSVSSSPGCDGNDSVVSTLDPSLPWYKNLWLPFFA
jgi:hypothetical protein